MSNTTPEQACAETLAAAYLTANPSRDEVLRVLRIAYLEGCTATLRADVARLGTAPVLEFSLPRSA